MKIHNKLYISVAAQSIYYYYLGQVNLPSNKSEIVVLPGSTARIRWTYVGDPNKSYRTWFFTSRNAGSKEEELAGSSSSHSVEDPATLVLYNVNASYNGKYRFAVIVSDGGGSQSSVELFVAGKF